MQLAGYRGFGPCWGRWVSAADARSQALDALGLAVIAPGEDQAEALDALTDWYFSRNYYPVEADDG